MSIRTEVKQFPIAAVSKRIRQANAIIPRKLQWALYIAALILSDAAMTLLAFWLAYYFRFEMFIQYFVPNAMDSFEKYRILILSMPALWLLIFAANGLYARNNLLGGTREYSKLFRSAGEGFLFIVILGFLEPTLIIARGWLLMAWANTFILATVARFLLRRAIYALRRHGFFLTGVIPRQQQIPGFALANDAYDGHRGCRTMLGNHGAQGIDLPVAHPLNGVMGGVAAPEPGSAFDLKYLFPGFDLTWWL